MREIFNVMSGFPVTIRLLDPPLHEFLPSEVRADRMCIVGPADLSHLLRSADRRAASLNTTSPPPTQPPTKPQHHQPPTTNTQQPKDIEALAARIGKDVTTVTKKIKALEEVNPMLGLRGCRLGLLYPEISEMQVRKLAAGPWTGVSWTCGWVGG
jgi:pyruvate, orthophosphate dikinase